MHQYKGPIFSKMPGGATSIFAVMSQLAADCDAVNLSQGFPDFEIAPRLIDRVHYYMKRGLNQYAPMAGVPALRQAIVQKTARLHQCQYHPDTEVTVTAGATQAIFTAISAVVRDGDEVIVFEPAYDAYVPTIQLNGGVVRYAQLLAPDYRIDWDHLARLVTPRTRMIIINSPHNPSGSVLSAADMQRLEKLTHDTDILVLSDEVYEHLIFDGQTHESASRYPDLASRTFVVGSFGKTFHATGWKTGYVLAPANLMKEFRKVHQWVVYASNTPVQYALADYLAEEENYLSLPAFYQEKRDRFLALIEGSRFRPVKSAGTYFQLLNYSAISMESEVDFARNLTCERGLASIPLSVFYHENTENQVLRFCFAKTDQTLQKAAAILKSI